MIEVKNLSFSYGDKHLFENFNLTVADGECVCITGKSGCGKTTLLNIISGIEKIQKGTVNAPEKISYVFQRDRLVPHMSIIKNIEICIPKIKKASALSLLKEAGLEKEKDCYPSELSGGMNRRAAIIRAVAYGGDAVLLDEPFNGLDFATKKIMAEIIKREFKGKSIIMVSHIAEDAELMNARIINIEKQLYLK